MSIWQYTGIPVEDFPYSVPGAIVRTGSAEGNRIVNLWNATACPFCKSNLMNLVSEKDREIRGGVGEKMGGREWESTTIFVCESCGWWKAERVNRWATPAESCTDIYRAGASLKELDLTDISLPIQEVRDYLVAKYESRSNLHPRVFEETVGSVFESLGYKARVTAYSGDDGIDVILDGNSDTIGVQVKRYKSTIQVEQIRSLAGALMLAGLTKGMFVTTSTFQSGALSTVNSYRQKGYCIELFDAPRFYDALKIAQREMYRSREDFEETGCLEELPRIIHAMSH